MRASRRASALAVLLAAGLAASAGAARAQEGHVFLVTGGSTSAAFDDVAGAGVGLTFRIGDHLRIQATLDTRESRVRRMGTACVNPAVNYMCITDGIETRNRFSSVSTAFLPTWSPSEHVRLGAGAGVVIGNADSNSDPDSGRQAKVFHRKTAHLGAVGIADVQILPRPDWPLVLLGQLQARRIDLNGCSADMRTYDPFCGADWWSELLVGVGVRF